MIAVRIKTMNATNIIKEESSVWMSECRWLSICHVAMVKSLLGCCEGSLNRTEVRLLSLIWFFSSPSAACLWVVNKAYFAGISQANLFVIIRSAMLVSNGAAASWIDLKHQLKKSRDPLENIDMQPWVNKNIQLIESNICQSLQALPACRLQISPGKHSKFNSTIQTLSVFNYPWCTSHLFHLF